MRFRIYPETRHDIQKELKGDSGYEPVSTIKFLYANFKLLQVSSRKKTTYDIGCGKGYLIKLLSLARYKRIVGLEWNEELYLVSKSNLNSELARHNITIFHLDASQFAFEDNSNIFCFNPFSGETFMHFVQNLTRSAQNSYIVYINDIDREFLIDSAKMISRNSFLRISIWWFPKDKSLI